jgi:serine/threonine protein kinase
MIPVPWDEACGSIAAHLSNTRALEGPELISGRRVAVSTDNRFRLDGEAVLCHGAWMGREVTLRIERDLAGFSASDAEYQRHRFSQIRRINQMRRRAPDALPSILSTFVIFRSFVANLNYDDEVPIPVVVQVMDWCERPLESDIATDGMDSRRAVELLLPVLATLDTLHCMTPPAAHRDVEPGSLVYRADGTLALLDAGFAAASGPGAEAAAGAGDRGANPPEDEPAQPRDDAGRLADSGPHPDPRRDMWLAGSTLRQMLLGPEAPRLRAPDLRAPDLRAPDLRADRSDPGPAPEPQLPLEGDDRLRDIALHLLDPNPAARPTAGEAWRELSAWRKDAELTPMVDGYLSLVGKLEDLRARVAAQHFALTSVKAVDIGDLRAWIASRDQECADRRSELTGLQAARDNLEAHVARSA